MKNKAKECKEQADNIPLLFYCDIYSSLWVTQGRVYHIPHHWECNFAAQLLLLLWLSRSGFLFLT